MESSRTIVSVTIELALEPWAAFEVFIEELVIALAQRGMSFETGAALRELKRVLVAGGRIVVLGSDPVLRGTPAAPEPMASYLRFYEADELKQLAEEAGFAEVSVVWRDLEPFARQVGIPEEHLSLFAGSETSFLLARRG